MMKNLLIVLLVMAGLHSHAQNWTNIGLDKNGDDHAFNGDAQSLDFRYNAAGDSIFFRINQFNARGGDFGYALALDTNLNTSDGVPVPQNNLVSATPNLSMNYDLIIYVYQNSFFPGVFADSYDAQSNIWMAHIDVDTNDQFSTIIGFPLSDLDGKREMNVLAFTGSFDIAPGGAGPSDVMPNSTYAEVRESGIGQREFGMEFGVYPNPARDHVFINYSGAVSLWNTSGVLITEKRVQAPEALSCIDLEPGMYYITTVEGIYLSSFVKL